MNLHTHDISPFALCLVKLSLQAVVMYTIATPELWPLADSIMRRVHMNVCPVHMEDEHDSMDKSESVGAGCRLQAEQLAAANTGRGCYAGTRP